MRATYRDQFRPMIAQALEAARAHGLSGLGLKRYAQRSYPPLWHACYGSSGRRIWLNEVRVQLGEITFPRRQATERTYPLFEQLEQPTDAHL
jgi:hypothetical protein